MSQTDTSRLASQGQAMTDWEEATLHCLYESAGQGIVATDAALNIRVWNRWLEIHSGRRAAEVLGCNLLEVYPELLTRGTDGYYREALDGRVQVLSQRLHRYLLPMRSKDHPGPELMAQSAQIIPLVKEGRVIGTVTLLEDVTERQERELALRESEQWLRTTLRSIGDAVMATDDQGIVTFVNPVAEELTGWTEAEAAGQPLENVFNIINEETGERAEHPVARVLREGIVVGLANHTVLIAKDGTKRPIADSGAPIRGERGVIVGTVMVFRDITEAKRAQEERARLLATEHEQRVQAETLAEVTLALASQLNRESVLDEILRQAQRIVPFTMANIALLEGDSLSVAHWEGDHGVGTEEFMLGLMQPLSDFSLDAETIRARNALVVPDTRQEPQWVTLDETAWIRSYLALPLCLGEQVLGLLRLDGDAPGRFSAADAERLQPLANAAAIALQNARLYDQARRDAETKATLLREVNHRVLNNLSALSGLLGIEARQAEAAGQITQQHLTQNLVSRINGLAAVHSLLSAAEWQPLQLSDLAGQVIHASQHMLPRDKQVVIDVAPSPVQVTPDQANSLALVINELAINTVRHALAGRDRAGITVRVSRQDDTLTLEFRDDGPGYPQEVIEFNRHRVGVYLLQNLVRTNLQGELSLHNDEGAVTTIRFPANVQGESP